VIVRELLTRFGFEVDEGKLRKLESGIGVVHDVAEKAAEQVDKVREKIELAIPALHTLIAAFALHEIAETADEMQTLQARVGMLAQTAGSSAEAFDEVAKHASATRMAIEPYVMLYTRIGQASEKLITNQQDLLSVTDTFAKELTIYGVRGQAAAAAMYEFSEGMGEGVFQGRQLRSLAIEAPGILRDIAKAAGLPAESLKNLGKGGGLAAEKVVEALKKMQEDTERRFRQMPMTIGSALQIMRNHWDVFINKLNQGSMAVTTVANMIIDGVDWMSGAIDWFTNKMGGATNVVKLFAFALTATLLPAVIKLAGGFLTWLISPFALIALGILTVLILLDDWLGWQKGKGAALGGLWETLDRTLKLIRDHIVAIGTVAGIYLVTALINMLMRASFWTAVNASVTGGWAAVTGLASGALGILTSVIEFILSPLELLVGLITMLSAGIGVLPIVFVLCAAALAIAAYLIYQHWDDIKKWTKEAIDSISKWWSGMTDGLMKDWDKFVAWFKDHLPSFAFSVNGTANVDGTGAQAGGSPLTQPKAPLPASATGAGGANSHTVNNNVTINQTVPEGTPAEQARAVKTQTEQAAHAAYGATSGMDYAMYQR
jgi:tape measure domain-containing protein